MNRPTIYPIVYPQASLLAVKMQCNLHRNLGARTDLSTGEMAALWILQIVRTRLSKSSYRL